MSQPLGVEGFVSYLADHPGATASLKVKLNAIAKPDPPAFFNAVPYGELFVFPDCFVFLTAHGGVPGAGMLMQTFLEALRDELVGDVKLVVKLHAWGTNPATFLLDAGKALWGSLNAPTTDYLQARLLNQNSFFVPFSKVASVAPGRAMSQGNYIKVGLVSGGIVLCQNMTRENLFKAGFSYLSGEWEPTLLAALREGAARRRVK